jgi:hypothetical protein
MPSKHEAVSSNQKEKKKLPQTIKPCSSFLRAKAKVEK